MRKRIVAISRALVGKTKEQAEKIAAENKSVIRIVEVNGNPVDVGYDLNSNRINVAILDGKIARIIGLG